MDLSALKEPCKVVVTGGCGFVGSHLVERLIEDGHEVVVIDNLSSGFCEYLPKSNKLVFLNLDITDKSKLFENVRYLFGAKVIFHLAACARIQPSVKEPIFTNTVNVGGTLNMLDLANILGCGFVYSASSSSYGVKNVGPLKEDMSPDPLNPYAASKYMGEMYCKVYNDLYKIPTISLKYFNVYGERSPISGDYAPVVGKFFRQLYENKDITIVGDGNQKRDMTYVSDVVAANIAAMNSILNNNKECFGQTFNIGTGSNLTINELACLVVECGRFWKPRYEGRIVYVEPRPGESRETLADISKAKSVLGWSPTVTLKNTLAHLASFYKND